MGTTAVLSLKAISTRQPLDGLREIKTKRGVISGVQLTIILYIHKYIHINILNTIHIDTYINVTQFYGSKKKNLIIKRRTEITNDLSLNV